MIGIIFVISGILAGSVISHYTAYAINNSEDCENPVEHRIFSIRNLIISILNGGLWYISYLCFDVNIHIYMYLIVASMLLAISVVDFAVFEIPPEFNIVIAVIGVINLCLDYTHWYLYLIGAVAVSGFFLIIGLITKGKGMGGGDVKLMAAAGLLLGWQKIIVAMFLGAVLGSVIHGIRMIISKKNHVLAFGPYLAAGIFIMMCYGVQLIQWYIDKFLTFE